MIFSAPMLNQSITTNVINGGLPTLVITNA